MRVTTPKTPKTPRTPQNRSISNLSPPSKSILSSHNKSLQKLSKSISPVKKSPSK
jgi:hypothetical protein